MNRTGTAASVLRQPGTRAMIAFVVVMIALIAALWPRGDDAPEAASPSPGTSQTGLVDAPVDDAKVAEARTAAALRPCPVGTGQPAGVLAGIQVPCMSDGTTIDLGAATAGRPLVINIWAVWCLPCRRELPLFDQLSTAAGDRLTVLGVHSREGLKQPFYILKFLEEVGVHLPVVTDPDNAIARAVNAPRVFPSTVFIRADGTVAAVSPRVFDSYDDLTGAVRENLGVDLGAA